MKKWLSVLLVVVVLFLVGVYFLVPSRVAITHYSKFPSTAGAAERFLQQERWSSWWPDNGSKSDSSFIYNGYSFSTRLVYPGSISVDISKGTGSYHSLITILPLSRDSVALSWICDVETHSNPITRLQKYNDSKRLAATMSGILDTIRAFLGKNDNVYSINITQTMVTDTLLVTTQSITPDSPSQALVYQMIDRLKKYIAEQKAESVNPPMLYIERVEKNQFRAQVAIPVNKPLNGTSAITLKRMVPGKILVAEVTGGPHTVSSAVTQMQYYAADYKKMSPAIPFEMMVTDRTQQPDTTRWVTRIYYPVL